MRNRLLVLLLCSIPHFCVASSGDPDHTFGVNGQVLVDNLGSTEDFNAATAIVTGQKILVIGSSRGGDNVGNVAMVRLNPDGSIDSTFGSSGFVTTSFNDLAFVEGAAIQGDGKILVVADVGAPSVPKLLRYLPDGSLDNSFGTNGIASLAFANFYLSRAVATDGNGNIVVVGTSDDEHFEVARVTSLGAPDTTFNGTGFVVTDMKGHADIADDVIIQADNKIVAGGLDNDTGGGGIQIAIARYNTSGTLDTTFGNQLPKDGKFFLDLSIFSDEVQALTLDGSQRIVFAGIANGNDFMVGRLTTTGDLDPSFGNVRITNIGTADGVADVAIQSDGKIVAAGSSDDTYALARYNTDGNLDNTFNAGGSLPGTVVLDITELDDFGASLAIQADSKIVFTGNAAAGGGSEVIGVTRFNTDGSLDESFNSSGIELINFILSGNDSYSDCVIQPDGKIVAVGKTQPFVSFSKILVSRFLSNGDPDPSFGNNGRVTLSDSGYDFGRAVALQTDGKIVISGSSSFSSYLLLARLNPDGTPDDTFDNDGILTSTLAEAGVDLEILPANRILVLANGGSANTFSPVLIRFNENGLVDATFGTAGKSTIDFEIETDALKLLRLSSGKIVIAGELKSTFTQSEYAIARLNEDGLLDDTFDLDGKMLMDFSALDHVIGLAEQPGNKLIVAGLSDSLLALARVTDNGVPDPDFGSFGVFLTNFGTTPLTGGSLAKQPDGKLLISFTADADILLARFLADGNPDTSFGTGTPFPGMILNDFGKTEDVSSMALQADGRIVIAGESRLPISFVHVGSDAMVARFIADCATLTLSPSALPDATIGTAYNQALSETGGQGPNTFLITTGSLPSGITLSAAGVLSGTTQVVGNFPFTVQVTDARGCTGSRNYSLLVKDQPLQPFLLFDDFEDSNLDWVIKKGAWQETGGELIGTGATTALAIAPQPWNPSGLSECSVCAVEVDVQTAGGPFNKLFVEGWFQNAANKVDLVIKEQNDKLVLKQKSGGVTVASEKASFPLDPDRIYSIRIAFDGSTFHVLVDGAEVITMPAGATPTGNVSFKVKNTTARFSEISVL